MNVTRVTDGALTQQMLQGSVLKGYADKQARIPEYKVRELNVLPRGGAYELILKRLIRKYQLRTCTVSEDRWQVTVWVVDDAFFFLKL
jgi:hypothetical protein